MGVIGHDGGMDVRVDGNSVRRLREARLWTQEELARQCGVHPRTVQRVEAQGTVSAQTLKAIAGVLGVDASALAATDEPEPRSTVPVTSAEVRLELPWIGIAAAFLWVALACLVHVPTAGPGLTTAAVAALGFASFVIGLYCLQRWYTGRTSAPTREPT